MNPSVFSVNKRGRDFVVGDLHGQMAMLEALLAVVGFDAKKDRLFSVGDLIDRGTHSAELLERFSCGAGFYGIKGNHEAMLIASDTSSAHFQSWQRNGGFWGASLPLATRLALAALADRLPLTITVELADGRRVGLVHAEVPLGKSWADACAVAMSPTDLWDTDAQSVAACLVWGRNRFKALELSRGDTAVESLSTSRQNLIAAASQSIEGIDWVVCGHNIVASRQPEVLGNTLFIDSGSYEKKGRLTMLEPLTGLYWQSRFQGKKLMASMKSKKMIMSPLARF